MDLDILETTSRLPHGHAIPVDSDFDIRDDAAAAQDPKDILRQQIERIYVLELPALEIEAREIIPYDRLPPRSFLESLSTIQRTDAMRGCILVFILSKGKAVPRDYQLQACLGPLDGRDTILCSGTGSGKTLVLILLFLLRRKDLSLLIVPLKRLQLVQVSTCS